MRVLEIHRPCDFDPSDGEPTADPAAVRCRACDHTVHDLSAMTAEEAIAFLDARKPGQCLSFVRGEDDRIVFTNGPGPVVGRVAKDARPMLVVATLLLAACDKGDRRDAPQEPLVPPVEIASAPAPEAPPTAAADAAAPASTTEAAAPTATASASAEASCAGANPIRVPSKAVPLPHKPGRTYRTSGI